MLPRITSIKTPPDINSEPYPTLGSQLESLVEQKQTSPRHKRHPGHGGSWSSIPSSAVWGMFTAFFSVPVCATSSGLRTSMTNTSPSRYARFTASISWSVMDRMEKNYGKNVICYGKLQILRTFIAEITKYYRYNRNFTGYIRKVWSLIFHGYIR